MDGSDNTEDFGEKQAKAMSLLRIFLVFFRIGLFTFGGGLAMLAVMRHELKRQHCWIDESSYWELVTVSTSFPGVMAVNVACSLGWQIRGMAGLVAAVAGVVLPSFLVIVILVSTAGDFIDNPHVASFMHGAAAAVAAVLANTSLMFFKQIKDDPFSLLAAAMALVLLLFLGWHPAIALLAATLLRLVLPSRKLKSRENP
ncbi:MAG: chromate transporter [Spirochaetaceae bacterium]|nr:MAG: chromate transporter [Spirochaetaceae bacterium]